MPFISYAQNFEDVMLWRAFRNLETGFYIDVGAAWPEQHSVTQAFYQRGWSGINIEPNPELLQALQAARSRDVNLGVALSSVPGHQTFHWILDTGLSTLDAEIAERHREQGYQIKTLQLEVNTLDQLWSEHVAERAVHFLKVDVEGFELQVLQGIDWQRHRPWIVVVEATKPLLQQESHAGWEHLLLGNQYRLVYVDGLNRFYLADEHAELASVFQYPPNAFDDFILDGVQQAEESVQLSQEACHEAQQRAASAEALSEAAQARLIAMRQLGLQKDRQLVAQAQLLDERLRLIEAQEQALRRIHKHWSSRLVALLRPSALRKQHRHYGRKG